MDLHKVTPEQIIAGEVGLLSSYNEELAQDLIVKVAAILYTELNDEGYGKHPSDFKLTKEFHAKCDNVLGFLLDNGDVVSIDMLVWSLMIMLTHYRLPLTPGRMKTFDRYHQKVMVAHMGTEDKWEEHMDRCRILAKQDNKSFIETVDCIKFDGWKAEETQPVQS
jgi:hypothetical protein